MAGNLISDGLLEQIRETIKREMSRLTSTFRNPVPQRPVNDIVHLAKSTSNISKGSTGDMTVYYRNSSGTPTITSPTVTLSDVMAELGAYTANKLAYVKMVGGRWVIVNTECSS